MTLEPRFQTFRVARVSLINLVRAGARSGWGVRPRDRFGTVSALVGALLFLAAELFALKFILKGVRRGLAELPDIRPELLVERAFLGGATLIFFLVLVGSLTTAISSLFLSDELVWKISLPIQHRALFAGRLFSTLCSASAPLLLLVCPLIAAAALGAPRSGEALFALLLLLASLVALAGTLGSAGAVALVSRLPARRAKGLTAFFSMLALASGLIAFRGARPERFFDPMAALSLVSELGREPLPVPALNPVRWVARAAAQAISGATGGSITIGITLCALSGVVFLAAVTFLSPLHLRLFREMQDGDVRTSSKASTAKRRSLFRTLLAAESMTVLRDASTPAQIGSLLSIFVLDLLNVRLLPKSDPAGRDVLTGLQSGLALFLVSALSLRFSYPAVSSDGRASKLLRSFPLSAARHLVARLFVRTVPSLVIALVLLIASDFALGAPPQSIALSLGIGCLGALTIPALHMGLGALFPRYDAPHPIAVALGAGGLLAMALSTLLSLSSVLVVSQELRELLSTLLGRPLPLDRLVVAWSLGAVLLGAVPMLLAARSLGRTDLAS